MRKIEQEMIKSEKDYRKDNTEEVTNSSKFS